MNALSMSSSLALELPNIAVGLLVVLFLFISVVMVLVVLIQRPQGGGLSGAFGSSAEGAGQTAFGAKTGDVLTTATIVIFLVFLTTAVVLNYAVRPSTAADEPAVAATDGTQGGTAPVEEQRVIPVTPQGQPMQSAAGTQAPAQGYITTPEGGEGPALNLITDPEILKQLEAGQAPAIPPAPAAKPAEEPATPEGEQAPPAEAPSGSGGGADSD